MQIKSLAYLLAAGTLLLPADTAAEHTERPEIHTVITADAPPADRETRAEAQKPERKNASADGAEKDAPESEDKKIAEEMDELGGEVEESETAHAAERTQDAAGDAGDAAKASGDGAASGASGGVSADSGTRSMTPRTSGDSSSADTSTSARSMTSAPDLSAGSSDAAADVPEDAAVTDADRMSAHSYALPDGLGAADEDELYGEETAIDPIALADGDWVFVEGDERRGWFVDRSKMRRNADGSLSYWQLILYNEFGRAQFARAMQDDDYKELRYTLQRRVLNPKKNTVRTYEIIAIGADEHVLADSTRDGAPAAIRPDTMAEKERDTVKKLARGLKSKR